MAAHSRLEEHFAAAWHRLYPLLPPQREVTIPPWEEWATDRKALGLARRRTCYRADFAWPAARVAVEVQGGIWGRSRGGHTSGTGVNRDCAKSVIAQCGGWLLLPLTDRMIIREATIWMPRLAAAICDRSASISVRWLEP
jgi:hypothetical protein